MDRQGNQPAIRFISANITIADLKGTVETFAGQYDVRRFIRDFEAVSLQCGWTDQQKTILVKCFVDGAPKSFLRVINTSSWSEVKRELLDEFELGFSAAVVHRKLSSRRKQTHETPQEYCIAMREIASAAPIEEADVVHYMIHGLGLDKNEILFFGAAGTFQELRELLRRYNKVNSKESFTTNAPEQNMDKIFSQQARTGLRETASSGPSLGEGHRYKKSTKCYNCNNVGHISSCCPIARRSSNSCFRCGNPEHHFLNCPLNSIVSSSVQVANIQNESGREYEFFEKVSFSLSSKLLKTNICANVLLDTGSPVSFIQAQFIPPVFIFSANKLQFNLVGINGSRMDVIGKVKVSVEFRDYLPTELEMLVVRNNTMYSVAILGRDFFEKRGLRLLPNRHTDCMPVSIRRVDVVEKQEEQIACNELLAIDTGEEPRFEINPKFSKTLYQHIQGLVNNCQNTSFPLTDNSAIEMRIRLSKEASFYSGPRRLSYLEKEQVRKILDGLLAQKIIRPSHSEFSSPIVLARKKDGSVRMCVDYREVNKVTVRDNYPLPLIEDQIDMLHGKRFFTCLDLKDGFHHVRMSEESIKYTSFVTPLGQFEYLRMPFGLKNAPSVFQRFINTIFRQLIDSNKVQIYMDDILVATTTIDEHIHILSEVFELIKQSSLSLNLNKCKFLFEEIDYLGYRVSAAGIRPNPQNIEAVEGFPVPKNTRDVRSFLGLCSYFRKFIRGFATIAKPLSDLIRKDEQFQFGDAEMEVFNYLKKTTTECTCVGVIFTHGRNGAPLRRQQFRLWGYSVAAENRQAVASGILLFEAYDGGRVPIPQLRA